MKTVGSSLLLLLIICQAANVHQVFANSQTKIIESFHVRSDIRYRLATTQIESVVRNVGGSAQEIAFDVTLPKEAFIISFSMKIDGKVYNGEVKEKTAAKRQYQDAVNRGESAGHVRQAPRHSNIFEVSTNVANGSAAIFTLTYQEMLRRKLGVYVHEVHINPGQAVDDFLVEIFIQEKKPLTVVKTPALRKGSLITNRIEAENRLTVIDRPSSETAHIIYKPSVADQSNDTTPAIFVVEYDVEHSLQGEVMVVDGYFVHFFSPDLPPMPKDIVFVLDVSGSMYGQKIMQLKDAMLTILDDLQPDDRFSITTFSSEVKHWGHQLVTATKEKINTAKTFITSIHAEGGTDINSALLAGISKLHAREDNQRVGMIFFLTDGLATSGNTNPKEIAANVLSGNKNILSIFGLAFGVGADYDLLTTICGQNSGFARKIYEDSDASLQVTSLYEEISAVSMKDISVNYLPSSVDEYTVTNRKFPVVFTGSEVIICGKMAENVNVFQMEIKGLQKSGSLDLSLKVDDVNNLIVNTDENLNKFFTMPRDLSGIVEKMWAYLTVKQYLKEKEIFVSDEAKAEELKNKILQISLKYKFVTPLTSMVVTKPESPDDKPMESGLEDINDLMQKSGIEPRPMHGHRFHHSRSSVDQYHSQFDHMSFDPESLQINSGPIYKKKGMRPALKLATVTVPPLMLSTFRSGTQSTSYVPSDFPVLAIIAETKDLSICMVPKSLKEGKYKLIQSRKGSTLDIETSCSGRKCKNFLIKSIIIKSNKISSTISLSKNEQWIYKTSGPFSLMNTTTNGFTFSAGDFEVKVNSVEMNGTKQYTLSIKVTSEKGYKGLIGKTLSMSAKQVNKWRKAKLPEECKDKAADISKYIKNKMMARYKV